MTACGRVGFEEAVPADAGLIDADRADAGPAPCNSLQLLSRDKPGTVIGTSFGNSSPAEAVDGLTEEFSGYWACMLSCSLILDLEAEQVVEELELWPGGNALPTAYYQQESWRVRYATAASPDSFIDFEGVEKLSGAGTLDEIGILISGGMGPGHQAQPDLRQPEFENYKFRVPPTRLRYIRFDGLEGDIDGDTNLDEIEVRGCAEEAGSP